MSKVKIFVGENYDEIDVSKEFNIDYTYNFDDLINVSLKKSNFSKTIKILKTPNTFKIFKNLFNVDSVDAFDITQKINAVIDINGTNQIICNLKIDKIFNDYYNVVCYTNNVDLFKKIGDKIIYAKGNTDNIVFDSSEINNHIPSRENIMASWSGYTAGDSYIYPYIQYNKYDGNYLNCRGFSYFSYIYPALSVNKLFDKILSNNGFTYTISDDIKNKLKKMYIPYNGSKYDADIVYNQDIAQLSFPESTYYYLSHSDLYEMHVDGNIYYYLNNFVKLSGDYDNYYFKDIPNNYLEYLIWHKTSATVNIHTVNGSRNADYNTTDGAKTTLILTNFKLNGEVVEYKKELDYDNWNGTTWTSIPCDSEFIIDNLEFGDKLKLRIDYGGYIDDDAGEVNYALVNSNNNKMTVKFNDWAFSDIETRNENDFLPRNYKQKDFINDILNTFNLKMFNDDNDINNLILKNRKEYLEDEIIDITNYVNIDSIEYYSLSNILNKFNKFSHIIDADDIYNDNYKKTHDVNLGSINIINYDEKNNKYNELVDETLEIKFNYPSTTMMQYVNYEGSKPINITLTPFRIPILDGKNETQKKSRLLFISEKTITSTNPFGWGYGNPPTLDKFITLDVYEDGNDIDSEDNFALQLNVDDRFEINLTGNTINNNTIYNKYYKEELEQNFNVESRIVECECILPVDFKTKLLKFTKIININNVGLFRVNKVVETLNTGKLKLTLQKIIDTSYISYDKTITPNELELIDIIGDEGSNAGGGDNTNPIGSSWLEDYFEWDSDNEILKISNPNGDSLQLHNTEGDIVAYASTGSSPPNFWDDMPYATEIKVGGVQVIQSTTAYQNGIRLNTTTKKLEIDPTYSSGGTTIWGDITGTLSNQIDLQAELDNKINTSLIGNANGVAELDSGGKVPTSQLPAYVDDVIEVADYASLPTTGESGKIYITIDDNKTYRWTGTGYAEISSSLALGETSSTAYRGDRGKIAYDHTSLSNNPHSVTYSQTGGEQAFSKNTAFNKNFGGSGSATTPSRSDHNHSTTYLGITAKATDSDKLDNLDSSQFLRSDASDSTSGVLTVNNQLIVNRSAGGDLLSLRYPASTTGYIRGVKNGVTNWMIGNAASATDDIYLSNYQNAKIIFKTNGSERFTIEGGGNVGIGTTNPTEALHVAGNIIATGEVTAYSSSDKRFKNNVEDIQNGLNTILKLRPVSYKWNDTIKKLNSTKVGDDTGLIAQEVADIIPEIVHDIYGDYKAINYGKLTPYLISAIKELNKIINKQQSQISTLEERINKLEKLI